MRGGAFGGKRAHEAAIVVAVRYRGSYSRRR